MQAAAGFVWEGLNVAAEGKLIAWSVLVDHVHADQDSDQVADGVVRV
jgi:hypothetical protein